MLLWVVSCELSVIEKDKEPTTHNPQPITHNRAFHHLNACHLFERRYQIVSPSMASQ